MMSQRGRRQGEDTQMPSPDSVGSPDLEYQKAYKEGLECKELINPSALSPICGVAGEGSTSRRNQHLHRLNPEPNKPDRYEDHLGDLDELLTSCHESRERLAAFDAGSQSETNYHHERRGNTKLLRAKQTSHAPPHLVAAKSNPTDSVMLNAYGDPDVCNPTLSNGTRLTRLCDTIPYLFGPNQYIEGYDGINSLNNPIITPEDEHGAPLFDSRLCGPHDIALLTILMFTGVPTYNRSPFVFHRLKPFNSGLRGEKLLCYTSDGPSDELLEVELDFRSYGTMLGDWQRSKISLDPGDYQQPTSNQGKILKMLKQKSVAVKNLDQLLFMHPVNHVDPKALLAKPVNLFNDFQSNHPQAYRRQGTRQPQHHISETFDYTEPDHLIMDAEKLYTHRFSHAYPSGQLHDFKSDNVGGIFQENKVVKENPPANRIDLSFMGSYFRGMSRLGRWSLISVCGLGVMAAVLVILYFRLGGNNKKGFY